MFVEPIRLFIRESVSLKGCHLGCHASQGIWRPECANVLQLRGENRQPLFHFLTSPEIELEAEPRYLYARFLYPFQPCSPLGEKPLEWILHCEKQAKQPLYPTIYRGQTEPNKNLKSSNNQNIHVSTFPFRCSQTPVLSLLKVSVFTLQNKALSRQDPIRKLFTNDHEKYTSM